MAQIAVVEAGALITKRPASNYTSDVFKKAGVAIGHAESATLTVQLRRTKSGPLNTVLLTLEKRRGVRNQKTHADSQTTFLTLDNDKRTSRL